MKPALSTKPLRVSWFSAGVSSAVACKLVADELDEIIYIHIDDQPPDSLLFVRECERWIGKPIQVLQSPYRCVDNVVRARRYISGPNGAPCTVALKKQVRKNWEREHNPNIYVWGFDASEGDRAKRLVEAMPLVEHRFPLIERRIDKSGAHRILKASGIARPAMYELGYHNNNCIGCVKGGMGYWNRIRVDFPDVFAARARLEREIGASCIGGVFLDELDPKRGRHAPPVVDDCGIFCELEAL